MVEVGPLCGGAPLDDRLCKHTPRPRMTIKGCTRHDAGPPSAEPHRRWMAIHGNTHPDANEHKETHTPEAEWPSRPQPSKRSDHRVGFPSLKVFLRAVSYVFD